MKYLVVLLLTLVVISLQKDSMEKIQPEVLAWSDLHGGKSDVMLEFEQVDMVQLEETAKKMEDIERGRYVYSVLKIFSEKSQQTMIEYLKANKIQHYVLWIQNTIAVYDVSMNDIMTLSKNSFVKNIWLNGVVDPEIEEPVSETFSDSTNSTIEWSIEHVKAPEVWKLGHAGKGMILGVSDTGVHFTHESLVKNYRGTKGPNQYEHNKNWFDATTTNSKVPVDSNGHGTHVMSTAAGGAGGRKVGVSPDAKWIACRPFGTSGRPADFIKCLQFFLAPHNLDGTDANPDLRPHVTSHSYVCRGCNLLVSIQALRAAGSLFVKSCGNSGPSCNSITEPGFYKEVICAGALATRSDSIASFSSRGPGQNGIMKPDFSAPGQNVNAAVPGSSNNLYRAMSGTSMAAPNLNGVVGLIWSAVPRLARKIDETIEILKKSSLQQTVTNTCSSNGSPNNVYGHGTLNALKAYNLAKELYGDK